MARTKETAQASASQARDGPRTGQGLARVSRVTGQGRATGEGEGGSATGGSSGLSQSPSTRTRTPDTRSCRDGHQRPPVLRGEVPPGKRRRVCQERGCHKTFSDKPHLNRHLKSAHGQTYVGGWTEATAEQTAAYRRHLNEVRNAERQGHRVACPPVRSRQPERQEPVPDLSTSQRLPRRERVPLHVACMEQSLRDDERPFGKRPWGPYAAPSRISTSERFRRQREESVRMNKAARLRHEVQEKERERQRYFQTPRVASSSNWIVEGGIVFP